LACGRIELEPRTLDIEKTERRHPMAKKEKEKKDKSKKEKRDR
jgi:hypothetical protein